MLFRHEMAINIAAIAEAGLPVPTGINAVELNVSTVREDLYAQAPSVCVLEYLEHPKLYHMLQMDSLRVLPAFETERDAANFAKVADERDALKLQVRRIATKDLEKYALEWDLDNEMPTLGFVPDGNTVDVMSLRSA
ncbi:hypothetical protein FVE85_6419 [Porphyridium purpureum]|uniref:Uncharacterized protein n=1 Tax=Porphyridium purpureum TaxID=35688 RepID=A0A5J4Z750_PORPP|nr:hypothetical protein FVE85_6419 [Porphyridium purpureum]|eukprot:POR5207..scf295_1